MTSPFSLAGAVHRIDPARQRAAALKRDGSVDDNDRVEIGPTPLAFAEWQALGLQPPNLAALRRYRLERLVGQLVARDLADILLFDPLNIRYATDTTNMQLWTAHNPARACFVGANGHVVLWDFHGCAHLSAHLPLVTELRSGASFFYFETGEHTAEHARHFGHRLPESCRAQRYGVMFHGVGLCDEYPCIRYPEDFESHGYAGVLEPGMALCVEAYIGEVGGRDGIKLENQLLVTEDGCEVLTRYPFEDSFLKD